MRLVLLGDIHIGQRFPPPWHLLGKPIVAQSSFWFPSARRRFDPAMLGPIVARAVSLKPDAVLFSGDFTTTALRGEFAGAAAALRPLLAIAPALAVPGNHDRYTYRSTLLKTMERSFREIVPASFPALRSLPDVAADAGHLRAASASPWRVLALNSARPTLLNSRGRLGASQRRRAQALLESLGPDQGVLVLCHYTLGKPATHRPSPWHHRLSDRRELLSLLAGCRARVLFLHGHVHYPWVWPRPEPELRGMLDVNAGAPTQVSAEFPRGQGFWEIELPAEARAAIAFRHHVPMSPDATGATQWAVRPVLGPPAD